MPASSLCVDLPYLSGGSIAVTGVGLGSRGWRLLHYFCELLGCNQGVSRGYGYAVSGRARVDFVCDVGGVEGIGYGSLSGGSGRGFLIYELFFMLLGLRLWG